MSEANFVQTDDNFINKLSKILIHISNEKNLNFILGQKEMTPELVFSPKILLAFFLLEAKENFEKIYNKTYSAKELLDTINLKGSSDYSKVPAEILQKDENYVNNIKKEFIFPLDMFESEPDESLLDFEPRIEHLKRNDPNLSFSVISIFVTHSFEEYIKPYEKNPSLLINGRLPLDQLCNKWFSHLQNNQEYLNLYSNEALKSLSNNKTSDIKNI